MSTSMASMDSTPAWRPKVIIFDLLTAPLNSRDLWEESIPSGTAEEGGPWRVAYLNKTFSTGKHVPHESAVGETARSAGLPESAPNKLLDGWSGVQTLPEVGPVLQRLKEDGYKLGVVTNSSKELGDTAALQVAKGVHGDGGKDDVSDAVVTAEESGSHKPGKEAYGAILDAMGVEAKDALFVAGSAGDAKGASEAGMKVWHDRAGLDKDGDWSPLPEKPASAKAGDKADTNGNWSPLKDTQTLLNAAQAESGANGNGSPSPLRETQSAANGNDGQVQNGSWSPLNGPRGTNGVVDKNAIDRDEDGNWSPTEDISQTLLATQNSSSTNGDWPLKKKGPDTDGNWSPIDGPQPGKSDSNSGKDGNSSQEKNSPDTDGNWSPIGGPKPGKSDSSSGKDDNSSQEKSSPDTDGNWSPIGGPQPGKGESNSGKVAINGSWSPLERGPTSNGTKDAKSQNGQESPLKDPKTNGTSNRLHGDGNWPLKDTRLSSVSGENAHEDGSWSPLKDPQRANGSSSGKVSNGNWSPLNGAPKTNGTSNGPGTEGSWSPLGESASGEAALADL